MCALLENSYLIQKAANVNTGNTQKLQENELCAEYISGEYLFLV